MINVETIFFRQRFEKLEIANNKFRLIEDTDDVLVAVKIDSVFAADAGIDLPQQGRRHEPESNAAQKGRSDESGDIAYNPASDSHNKG